MELLKVRVFGEEYPLRVEDKNTTLDASRVVENLMKSYRVKAPDLSVQQCAVLSAIYLAEQHKEVETRLNELIQEIKRLNNLSKPELEDNAG
jgi:cell division protein ZapA (FtsZ GTPase activity inhibitor)